MIAGSAFAVGLAWASLAAGHEFWIEPRAFWLAGPGKVTANLMVGSDLERDRWSKGPGHVARAFTRGPGGEHDVRAALLPPTAAVDAEFAFARPGLHMVAMQTRESRQELPAARFNTYAKDEGLTLVLADRARTGREGRPGREAYSRRAKTLVQVGAPSAAGSAVATARLGFTLEIVAERDPLGLKGDERLPVRIFYEGKPLAGATVALHSLDIARSRFPKQVTDASGRASFAVPRTGSWLLSSVWSKPVKRADADFETVFASLTFGYPPGAKR